MAINIALALFGLLIRIGIPLAITILMVVLLRRLDERWQAAAASEAAGVSAKNPGCWDIRHCTEEQQAHCSARQHPDIPCWQYFRESDGLLKERCLVCEIFRSASAPAAVHV